tara:strand:- start:7479 stop:7634 length:156 start_codon:yes stop_codon:yes gene_type:complete
MSHMYDEYVEARNEALVVELDKYSKADIIRMILRNSNDDYLEAMYQHICKK